jgi:hypothetical protein
MTASPPLLLAAAALDEVAAAERLDTRVTVAAALRLADPRAREAALRDALDLEILAGRILRAAGRDLTDCALRPAATVYLATRARAGEAAARRELAAIGCAVPRLALVRSGLVPLRDVLAAALDEVAAEVAGGGR